MTVREALNSAMEEEMIRDDTVFIMYVPPLPREYRAQAADPPFPSLPSNYHLNVLHPITNRGEEVAQYNGAYKVRALHRDHDYGPPVRIPSSKPQS